MRASVGPCPLALGHCYDGLESREQESIPNIEYTGQVPIDAVASITIAAIPSTGESTVGSETVPARMAIEIAPETAPTPVLRALSTEPTF